ncbi:hypothetical protein ENUP19_0118G0048 [Entamoeba nuttalli]
MDIVIAHCKGTMVRRTYDFHKMLKRKFVVNEIFETELNFVTQLNMVIVLFKKPLEDAKGKILPKLLIRTLFHNIDQVMTAACMNANIFQKCIVDWKYDSCFGKSILSTLSNMLPLVEYTLRSDMQKKELQNAYKNKIFKGFVQLSCSEETTKKLSLEDLLITPIQRLMRYHTLLTELLKYTPLKHPDYKYIVKADQKFHDLVIATNTRAKQHDLLLTCASVIYGMPELVQPWRYCIYYEECYVNGLKTKSMCFLFNDVIVWMDTVVPLVIEQQASYFLKYEETNQIYLTEITNHFKSVRIPNCYEIILKDKHYSFVFLKHEHLNTWVNVLHTCLNPK